MDTSRKENEWIEIALLLEAVYLKYNYDFKDYSMAHLKRRIKHFIRMEGIAHISQLQHKIIYDSSVFERLLAILSINVTEMFRDPSFYNVFRRDVLPLLKSHTFIKIWHAGCASGEEVYSMAILLEEEGLFHKTQMYATDFNRHRLKIAQDGIYPAKMMKEYAENYLKAGGRNTLADYYTAKYDSVIIDPMFRQRIVFSDHNLVTDGVFGEMNVILCRNVLIYFTRKLQDHVAGLFLDSLTPYGFLCLGAKESLKFSKYTECFEIISDKERIYQKKGGGGGV
ncbi:MAG: protein-glutamate O-methyltransferase CheR [bacterium]|nr:protein-glutamate O-methyltransferase CheR [bacterium]